mmetsp:Transcript_12584/g.34897  ORF Transcript_12584/g.34897 Transcript_12584/m.34897 type:complete len:264 (+) Transcript_12584:253-1044(+)
MSEERTIEEEELRVYRALYPRESHAAFLAILNGVRTGQIPDAPTRIPLFHDASLPDSQKARFELRYLQRIFQSWLTSYPLVKEGLSMAKALSMQAGECAKLHLEYEHDKKLYQSFPRIGAKVVRQNIEYYLEIPMSNDGYVYRMMPDTKIARHNITLHRGTSHPEGIQGFSLLHWDASSDFLPFLSFARAWFQCRQQNIKQAVFYNGSANRVDVVMERLNHPRQGDKVSITLCFEPGWPIQEIGDCLNDVGGQEIEEIEGIDG